jgi:hypothetical protein
MKGVNSVNSDTSLGQTASRNEDWLTLVGGNEQEITTRGAAKTDHGSIVIARYRYSPRMNSSRESSSVRTIFFFNL